MKKLVSLSVLIGILLSAGSAMAGSCCPLSKASASEAPIAAEESAAASALVEKNIVS